MKERKRGRRAGVGWVRIMAGRITKQDVKDKRRIATGRKEGEEDEVKRGRSL